MNRAPTFRMSFCVFCVLCGHSSFLRLRLCRARLSVVKLLFPTFVLFVVNTLFTLYREEYILVTRLADPNAKSLRLLLDQPDAGGQFHHQRQIMLAGGQAFEV